MKYDQAPSECSEDEGFPLQEPQVSSKNKIKELKSWRQRARTIHLMVLYAVNIALLLVLVSSATQPKLAFHDFYSPARDIVKYRDAVFLNNIHEVSPFQGPPDDVKDGLWDNLYRNTSTTVIDAESAKRLPNRTMVVPGTNGDGIISLEVFHQLHCLNSLRKSLYPERFPDYGVFFPNGTRNLDISTHHDHCVDRIRQATVCTSNLGATYWRWNETLKKWRINMETTQTCRNFDDIRQWAVARNLPTWDDSIPSRLTD